MEAWQFVIYSRVDQIGRRPERLPDYWYFPDECDEQQVSNSPIWIVIAIAKSVCFPTFALQGIGMIQNEDTTISIGCITSPRFSRCTTSGVEKVPV